MAKKIKLLTKEIIKRFKEVGSQENVSDPIVIAKFFNPYGIGTWYATEYDPKEKMFFGYVRLHEGEFGYFSLEELEETDIPIKANIGGKVISLGTGKIERDLYCDEQILSQHLGE